MVKKKTSLAPHKCAARRMQTIHVPVRRRSNHVAACRGYSSSGRESARGFGRVQDRSWWSSVGSSRSALVLPGLV